MGRLHTFLACALVIVGVAAPARAEQPSPQQKIAMMSKPSVVRVWGAYIGTFELAGEKFTTGIGGTGTGWFMTPDGYIATNAHVVADIKNGEDVAKGALLQQLYKDIQKRYGAQLAKMTPAQLDLIEKSIKLVNIEARHYVVMPDGTKLDYDIVQYGKPGTGSDCAIIKVKIENAPTLPIGDSTRSQVEDHIVVIGYPGVADFADLLDEKSQLQASVTDGAISSLKKAASGEQILQISAPITHGNSGGPAIDQRGNVVGLATFGNEGDVQGFNFLVASSTLMELVKKAKIEPKQSDTNKAWNSGLEHYWADEFTDAIHDFEEVQVLFPIHSEAAGLIRSANQAKKDGKEKQPESNTGLIVALVIGGLVLLTGAVVIMRRGKRQPGQAGMPPLGIHPGMSPPHGFPPGAPQPQGFPPQGFPPPQSPQGFQPQGFAPAPQMYGRAPTSGSGNFQPVAKTMAVGAAAQAGGIAPTAFGSLSIGSLTCVRGPLQGQRFALTATGMIVGRQPGVAHILVNDHRASGKHVWIGIEQGKLVAIDQGTTNGTYLNDIARGRITRAELRDGDVVIVSEPDCCALQVKLG
ncbi:MAG: trypsin-like peptidase domain-containing protein [Kofleriaceae bacterium]